MKDFSKTYFALGDYDINKIYVDKESLDERGLTTDDLMNLVYEDEDDDYQEKSSISVLNREELAQLMEQQDVVLSF
jgi:tRNA 2-thiouridine synthesizing protein C